MSAFSVSMEWKFFCNFALSNSINMELYHEILPCNLSNTQNFYFEFWKTFNLQSSLHTEFNKEFTIKRKNSIRGYEDFSIGRDFHIVVKINLKQSKAILGIYFNNIGTYKRYYNIYRNNIENQIPYKIDWSLWKTKGSAYINESFNIEDKNQWTQTMDWLLNNAVLMKKVFCLFD